MKKISFYMLALVATSMLAISCSKSKRSSTESGTGDYETISSSSGEHNGGSGYTSEESSYASGSTYSTDDSDSDDDSYAGSVGSVSDNEDWDEFLKSYDEFADKYIALLKKVQKGDVSAISEYADYMDKAQNFAIKISSASGDLTASQLAKFNRIQQKIIKAASSVKIDHSKLDAAEKAMESLNSQLSSFDDDDDDDDSDDDW